MSFSRTRAFFLAFVIAGSLFGQAAINTLRTLTTEGIAFKLPSGWEWQSEIASNIAIKKEIKVKDQAYAITADLVYAADGFVEDTVAGIEKKVAASKGDLKDLKTTRGEKFAGSNATLVSYTRVRGEKKDEFEDERQYLLRRNGALYTWTERASRAVASQAQGAFSAARGAISFTAKDTSREPKTWPDAGLRYVVPADFEVEKTEDFPRGGEHALLLHIGTLVTVGKETFYAQCVIGVQKSPNTLDDVHKQGKDIFDKSFEAIQDFKIIEKEQLKGQKALLMSFNGVPIPEKPRETKPARVRRNVYWFKHKGYVISWNEVLPMATNPALEAALKKARDGLSWQ